MIDHRKEQYDRDVQYQRGANGAERCGNCAMFIRPNECSAVKGHIEPGGWCRVYVAAGVHPGRPTSRA